MWPTDRPSGTIRGVAMRTVREALQALSKLTNFERTRPDGPRDFDLARPRALLAALGSPERRVGPRVVQVAGTKGKGSTARFVDSCLRAAGLRTGRFLSPHLVDVRERITVVEIPRPLWSCPGPWMGDALDRLAAARGSLATRASP